MKKKRILMVCEAFGGGVFTYVSQLCNDMVDEFDLDILRILLTVLVVLGHASYYTINTKFGGIKGLSK